MPAGHDVYLEGVKRPLIVRMAEMVSPFQIQTSNVQYSSSLISLGRNGKGKTIPKTVLRDSSRAIPIGALQHNYKQPLRPSHHNRN
jgi:hypothetical protein